MTAEKVRPGALPTGARPKTSWLEGSRLHLASGSTTKLPLPAGHDLNLVMQSPRGWVVVDWDERGTISRVAGGRARPVARVGHGYSVLPSEDSRRLMHGHDSRTGSNVEVVGLGGHKWSNSEFEGWDRPVGLSGGQAVLDGDDGTATWTFRDATAEPILLTDRHSALADVAQDLLFVYAGGGLIGPTKLSSPGDPEWAADFSPYDVSDDGSLVLGVGASGRVQVRSMDTGAVVRELQLARPYHLGSLVWDADGVVLMEGRTDERSVLVRCQLAAPCRRATPFVSRDIDLATDGVLANGAGGY